MTTEATLLALLAEIRGLRADLARWQATATPAPYGTPWQGPRWEAASTHASPTGTVRSGWQTPPPSYMHEDGWVYRDRPSMIGP